MSKHYITQSLLSAWNYIFNAYDTDKAYADFLLTLNKEPFEPNAAMQKGIEFENAVAAYCRGGVAEDTEKEVGDIVKGGQFQVVAYKDVKIDGVDIVLYSKMDVLKAGIIYDIKRSDTYEVGKYIDSPQHPMYMACVSQAKEFVYLISDGKEVYQERYTRDDIEPITEIIKDFFAFLRVEKLFDIYLSKWVWNNG